MEPVLNILVSEDALLKGWHFVSLWIKRSSLSLNDNIQDSLRLRSIYMNIDIFRTH